MVQDGSKLIPTRNGSRDRHIDFDDISLQPDLALLRDTRPRHLQSQLILLDTAGLISERHEDAGTALAQTRMDLHILDPNLARGLQFESADDAIPICLDMIRNAVGIRTHIDSDPVVHQDGEAVFPRRGVRAEFKNMRRCQAVAFPHQRVVEPHLRFPMAALQKKRDTPPRPIVRDFDVTLIPCRSHIMPLRLQPKRNLDVAGFTVFCIPLLQVPRAIEDTARPLRLRRDLFAQALLLE